MLGRLGSLGERGFCFFAISVLTGGYVGVLQQLTGGSGEHGAANPYSTAAMGCIAAGLAILCPLNAARFLAVARRGFAVNLFLLLALASIAWSFAPAVTFRRDLTLLVATGFAYYAVARFPMEQIVRMLAGAFTVAAIASAAVAIAMPQIGVMTGTLAGSWNGVFAHKSSAGAVMALGCLCSGWLLLHDPPRRVRHGAGLAICLAVAVMTRSSTSLLSILVMVVIGACLPLARARRLPLLWIGFASIIGAALAGAALGIWGVEIVTALDKDPDLTGRVPLWGLMLEFSGAHLLGYGYGAFWLQWNPDAEFIWRALHWDVLGSHNAWIEMMIQLGIPGVLLAAAVHLATIRQALLAVRRRSAPWASFAAVYAISFIVVCMVEGGLFQAGDINCMLLALVYVALRTTTQLPATVQLSFSQRRHPTAGDRVRGPAF